MLDAGAVVEVYESVGVILATYSFFFSFVFVLFCVLHLNFGFKFKRRETEGEGKKGKKGVYWRRRESKKNILLDLRFPLPMRRFIYRHLHDFIWRSHDDRA